MRAHNHDFKEVFLYLCSKDSTIIDPNIPISSITKNHRLIVKLEANKLAMPFVLVMTCYPWSLQAMLPLHLKKSNKTESSPNLAWVLL